MTKSQQLITRAFNANAADFLSIIASREHIDLNSISVTDDRLFVIGEPKTGRYITLKTVTEFRESATHSTYTHLVFSVTLPGRNYQEHLSATDAGAIPYNGEQLKAKIVQTNSEKLWALWSEEHQGFIGFDNNLKPYCPSGGYLAVRSLTNGGIVANASIFIFKE